MALKLAYDTKEEIPEAHRELFTEKDEKWHLTEVDGGIYTQEDIDKLNKAVGLERTATKKAKEKMKVWGDMDQAKVVKDLEELTELRAAKEAGEGDDKDAAAKFEAKVEATVKARTATLENTLNRKVTDLEKANTEQAEQIVGFKETNTLRTIGDAVRKAGVAEKIIDTAMEDVLMLGERVFEINDEKLVLTKEGVGCTPGIAPDIWLAEMKEKRSHWWPVASGGGANGSGSGKGFANNPWTREHWNLTQQGQAVREDSDKAARMATAAGTKIGATMPTAPKK